MPYIAEGTYGCVFSPPLKCEKSTNNTQAGKIFRTKSSMREEKKLAEKIKKIDNKGKWTVPYFGNCTTDIRKASISDNVHNCKWISRYTTEVEQLIYQNGGIDLHQLVTNFKLLDEHFFLDDLIPLFIPLLKGLKELHNKEVAHCDIKPPNMLYNFELHKLYIIDFGLLQSYNKIGKRATDYLLQHTYPYYPPEFKIYSYMILHNQNISNLHILSNYRLYGIQPFVNYMYQFMDIPTELTKLIDKCSADKNMFKSKFNSEYISKIDVYSLGMTFIEIIFKISQATSTKNKIKNFNYFNDFLTTVIIPMIQIDPDKRYNASTALNKLELLLKKYNISETSSSQSKSKSPNLPVQNCQKLKRVEIIELLKKVNKPTYGNKKILCDRLHNIAPSPKPNVNTAQKNCEKQKAVEIKKQLERQNKPKYGTKKQMCERLLKT